MMPTIKVSMDTAQLKRALDQLGRRAPQAILRALNKTARTVRTQALREIRKEIRLPAKDLRPMLPMIPATKDHLEAKIVARGRAISLMRLGAKQTRLGVTYKGPGGRVFIRSAFIATMPGRRRPNVWVREDKPRLPIEKQVGPVLSSVVIAKGIFEAQQAKAAEALAKNLEHEATYLLSQVAKRKLHA